MYTGFLLLHSWLRWVVILAGLLVFVRGSRFVNSTTRFYTVIVDVQLLLGLVLYVALSPFTRLAFQNMAVAMRDPGLRFWAVEHLTGTLLAVVAAHVGRGRVRRAPDERVAFQRAAIFVGVSLVLILISIPWPGMSNGRPLFRF
jgi:hypothetical protein